MQNLVKRIDGMSYENKIVMIHYLKKTLSMKVNLFT